MDAQASDPEGDDVSFEWEVIGSPNGSQWELEPSGATAWFAADALGDYELRVIAEDDLGASHKLDFPLHIVTDNEPGECDLNDIIDAAMP